MTRFWHGKCNENTEKFSCAHRRFLIRPTNAYDAKSIVEELPSELDRSKTIANDGSFIGLGRLLPSGASSNATAGQAAGSSWRRYAQTDC